jgi:hypothetical protein
LKVNLNTVQARQKPLPARARQVTGMLGEAPSLLALQD